MSVARGRFLTLEGGEGGGKTTQRARLVAALRQRGLEVVETREPGGAPGAEAVRRLLVEGTPDRWDARTEALLHAAARRDHLVRTVWPALERGAWVVSDRFADSTRAYQGAGHGLPLADLEALHAFVCGGFQPDLTLILDLPVAEGLARARGRAGAEQRYEQFDRDFHERVRQGFLDLAREAGGRCRVIDARADVESVHHRLLALVLAAFPDADVAL